MRRRLKEQAVEGEDSIFAMSCWTPSGEVSFPWPMRLMIGCGVASLSGPRDHPDPCVLGCVASPPPRPLHLLTDWTTAHFFGRPSFVSMLPSTSACPQSLTSGAVPVCCHTDFSTANPSGCSEALNVDRDFSRKPGLPTARNVPCSRVSGHSALFRGQSDCLSTYCRKALSGRNRRCGYAGLFVAGPNAVVPLASYPTHGRERTLYPQVAVLCHAAPPYCGFGHCKAQNEDSHSCISLRHRSQQ